MNVLSSETKTDAQSEIKVWVPETPLDYLTLISDIAVDYDGYRTPDDLMELIDEMAGYARQAIKILLQQESDRVWGMSEYADGDYQK